MKRRKLMGGMAGLIAVVSVCVQAGPFDSWSSKMRITFAGYNGTETLTNFPALVVLNQSIPEFLYSQFAATNGYELRFVDSTELTELNYETERWNTDGSSYVWVQVPVMTSNCYIWAYWGNSSAASAPAVYTTNGATWDSNYVAVYHLNDTSGSFALDSTTNRHNGSLQNGVSLNATGMVDGAFNFDSSQTQYINCGTSPSLDLTNNFTISMWYKRASVFGDFERLVGKTPSWAAYGIDISVYPAGDVLSFKVSANPTILRNAEGLQFGTSWHPVAVTLQDGTSAMIYYDGVRRDNSGSITQPLPANPTIPLYIGAYQQSAGVPAEACNGTVDEVRFEVAVRSPNWLRATYMTVASNATFTAYDMVRRSKAGTVLMIR